MAGDRTRNTYSKEDIAVLEGLLSPQKRPWQLAMTSTIEIPAMDTAALDALTAIFDLLPGTSALTVRTGKNDTTVYRDFPSGYTERVDSLLAAIFRACPAITGIVFPAKANRPAHTATPDDPFWSPEGKPLDAVKAAKAAGEISPAEAIEQIKALYASRKTTGERPVKGKETTP